MTKDSNTSGGISAFGLFPQEAIIKIQGDDIWGAKSLLPDAFI